jgi:hypothetical protein
LARAQSRAHCCAMAFTCSGIKFPSKTSRQLCRGPRISSNIFSICLQRIASVALPVFSKSLALWAASAMDFGPSVRQSCRA